MGTDIGGSSHVSIEITPVYETLVSSIRNRMERAASQGCICKVNEEVIRNCDDLKAYVPDKVSIGPFHRGSYPELTAMEDQKWRYLYALVNREPKPEATLNKCVEALKEMEPQARLFYEEEPDICQSSDAFVKMMLVDGGFIIELFLKAAIKALRRRNDPIFTIPGMLYRVRLNLILLENQIPFFIIKELFRIVPIPKQCHWPITDLALYFFKSIIPGDHQVHKDKYSQESNHLLDLVRHCYLPTIPRIQAKEEIRSSGLPDHATNLSKSRIKLRRRKVENLLDIKFNKGVLEIPTIHIHHYTETLFRNFIAYEQCRCSDNQDTQLQSQHISSYVLLIKSLIVSDEDVKFLDDRDIVLTDDNVKMDDIYQLFKRLGTCALKHNETKLKDFYFDGLCEQVYGYKPWNWWRTRTIKKDVPWSMLLMAAFLLLGITCFGTLFSILAFLRRH